MAVSQQMKVTLAIYTYIHMCVYIYMYILNIILDLLDFILLIYFILI
jgi:hypothetical protein